MDGRRTRAGRRRGPEPSQRSGPLGPCAAPNAARRHYVRARQKRPARHPLHRCKLDPDEITARGSIPVTTPARTLFDLAEAVELTRLKGACEEADRLGQLRMKELERVTERGWGRHALKPIRPIVAEARHPKTTRSPLEGRFLDFCREQDFPSPATNVVLLGFEVDALWPQARLIAELDSWEFHHHRAAFERDRARDAVHLVAGSRTNRVTDRRLRQERQELAAQIRGLLGRD